MNLADTVILPRWLVPVRPAGAILEDHAVVVADGRISDLLPRDEALRRYQAHSRVELPSHVLIPGLINTHTHSPMSLLRGLADDLPLMTWLKEHIWPAELQWVSEDFVRDGTELAIAEMLRGGTTCFQDMYFFPEVSARVAANAGIRACIGLILVDFPSAWADGPEAYISKGLELHDAYRDSALITTAFAPHAPYTVSDEPLRRVADLAQELDLAVHIHVHESAEEVQQDVARYGVRPLQRLADLGLVSHRLIAVHATQLLDGEIEALADAGSHVVRCPESNLKLASGFTPVARLLHAGVNVALGTDGAASNNDLNMLGEMRTASLLQKGLTGDPTAGSAHSILEMATLNGARALGLDRVVGSLEVGKAADMAAVDLAQLETQPLYNPVSQLAYAADRHLVTDVWVAGRRLLNRRQLTTLDVDDILGRTREWQRRIGPER